MASKSGRGLDRSTLGVRAGIDQDGAHGAVIPPLYLSSNFSFAGFEQKRRYDYSRSGNPTRDLLGDAIAELEGGVGAVVTASGMAAVELVLSEAGPGDLVLAPHDCYGGTYRLLTEKARRGLLRVAFVDFQDDGAVGRALAERPKLVLIETPSNPLLRIVDIALVAAVAHAAGAIVAVDNTFLSPVLQRPIALGADLVIHSTTKYLNGHSDVVGGAVVAADAGGLERLAFWANCTGLTGAPFDAFLTLRGLRTIFVRVAQQEASAALIAERLAAHPQVSAVYYPGLADHPGHAIAKRQQSGFGAMLSFDLHGGREALARLFEGVRIFTLAESLGGVESLISHPETMSHASMDADRRAAAGVTSQLVRLSIGLEHPADLVDDLLSALET